LHTFPLISYLNSFTRGGQTYIATSNYAYTVAINSWEIKKLWQNKRTGNCLPNIILPFHHWLFILLLLFYFYRAEKPSFYQWIICLKPIPTDQERGITPQKNRRTLCLWQRRIGYTHRKWGSKTWQRTSQKTPFCTNSAQRKKRL